MNAQRPRHRARTLGRAMHPMHVSLIGAALAATSCRLEAAEEHVRPVEPERGRGSAGAPGGGDAGSRDGGMDASVDAPAFTVAGLLAAVGECALGRYAEFEQLARELRDATAVFAGDPSTQNRQSAQAAYHEAMASWQRAELFRIGPAARTPAPGARNLRDQIYFFPSNNPCLVDQQIVNQRYAEPSFATGLASARGLSALEYLLFYDGPDNACSAATSINAGGAWAVLSMSELTQRRADYAQAAAADLLNRATELRRAWEASGGDFVGQFGAPGQGSAYASEQAALEALTAALFYLDQELKDLKLGTPLGLTDACPNAPQTCPDALESRYARLSKEHIRQNLEGFRMAFEGCGPNHGGLGIDDWLRSKDGGADLAERMLAGLDGAEATIANMGSDMEDAIAATPPDEVRAVHTAVKAITDLFKTEMINLLMVSLPASSQGDND